MLRVLFCPVKTRLQMWSHDAFSHYVTTPLRMYLHPVLTAWEWGAISLVPDQHKLFNLHKKSWLIHLKQFWDQARVQWQRVEIGCRVRTNTVKSTLVSVIFSCHSSSSFSFLLISSVFIITRGNCAKCCCFFVNLPFHCCLYNTWEIILLTMWYEI